MSALALAATVLLGQASASPALVISEELHVSRSASAHEWPFTVERGDLVCVSVSGQRTVVFTEGEQEGEKASAAEQRSVVVSANPFALFASYEDRALFAPYDSLETLVRRLAPFEAMGTRLCEGARRYP